jgi:hypothetical protein
METFKQQALQCGKGILWTEWMRFEARFTDAVHRFELHTQIAVRFRTLGPSSVLCRQGTHLRCYIVSYVNVCLAFYFFVIE